MPLGRSRIAEVIPSALLIVLGLGRILYPANKPSALSRRNRSLYALKIFYALALIAADATALGTSPVIILPLYLLFAVLCGVVRIRTFALAGLVHTPFVAAFCASLALRCCMNVMENIGKAWLIKEDVAPEETATFMARLDVGARQPPVGTLPLEKAPTSLHSSLRVSHYLALPDYPDDCLFLAEMAQPVAIHDAIDFLSSYSTNSPLGGTRMGPRLCVPVDLLRERHRRRVVHARVQPLLSRAARFPHRSSKALACHVEVAKDMGSGRSGNMMNVETEIVERMKDMYQPLSILVLSVLGFYQLYQQIGVSFVITLIGCLILMGATPLLSHDVGEAQATWTARTEERQKLTASILRNIVPARLMAYTDAFYRMIHTARGRELDACCTFWRRTRRMLVLSNWGAEFLSLVTIDTYAVVKIVGPNAPPFTTARMSTVIAIINLIGMPITELGEAFAYIIQAWLSVKRVKRFLLAEDKPATLTATSTIFSNASFGHGGATFLHDLTTTLPNIQLTMVIGPVGCGKSTLLHAAAGEVSPNLRCVPRPRHRDTAYCAQDAWLRAESIRSAIVFVSPYDPAWYAHVLRALALDRDLAGLKDGDGTPTGHLSGGQRQRADRALDANTEEAVWEALFHPERGLLSGVVGNAWDGRARAQIRFPAERASDTAAPAAVAADEMDNAIEEEQHLDESKRETVRWDTSGFYLGSVGRWRAALYLAFCVASSLVPLAINIYQNYWTSSFSDNHGRLVHQFGGYIGFEVVAVGLFMYYATGVAMPHGARGVHTALLDSVLRYVSALYFSSAAPLTVIEASGIGKILNRFSSDLYIIDVTLPVALMAATRHPRNSAGSIRCIICSLILLMRMASGPFERSKASNISPTSTRHGILVKAGQRWLVGQIKMSVSLINAALICFAVALRHTTSAGLFAVALTKATSQSLTERLNWFFITWVDVEICIVAAERIKELADCEPEEAESTSPEKGSETKKKVPRCRCPVSARTTTRGARSVVPHIRRECEKHLVGDTLSKD
ncbi:hypothetical protein B0H13DRAFT_2523444 [Mycena leptocephala]|nr:hypothetical protein B0H13DRAFT_2523444 [Mycena leptocephala]